MNKTLLAFSAIAILLFGTFTSNAQEQTSSKDIFTKIDNYLTAGSTMAFLEPFL